MRVLVHLGAALLLLVVLTQDMQVFAEKMRPWLGYPPRVFAPAREGESADGFVRTSDGEWIHFRRWQAKGRPRTAFRVAVLHHGNLGTMDGYRTVPAWLATLGVTSYVYDYRGYGRSSGFPSERGLYRDAGALLEQALRNEGAGPGETLTFGHSLGGGPAAYLAARHGLGALVLAGTYTSVPEQARTHPLFGWLSPYVWTEFPNQERVSELDRTCLIVLHGGRDNAMPAWMARRLAGAYRGRNRVFLAEDPEATHDSIVMRAPELAGPLLPQCAKN